jgi:hypothetical protein
MAITKRLIVGKAAERRTAAIRRTSRVVPDRRGTWHTPP